MTISNVLLLMTTFKMMNDPPLEDNKNLQLSDVESSLARKSHFEIFGSRDWTKIDNFWGKCQISDNLPTFVAGSGQYGVTNLEVLHRAGLQQFNSSNPRYKRKTFAVRIGYQGSKYDVRSILIIIIE